MIPFILLFIGLMMVYAEFFLPGGVMGGIGGLLIIGSIFLFASQSQSIYWTVVFVLVALLLTLKVIYYALYRIQHSDTSKGIYSFFDQEGYQASSFDKTAIGKSGIVSSDLKPGGKVLIEGKTHVALSKSGYIPKGEPIKVIGGEGESLIVKHTRKETL